MKKLLVLLTAFLLIVGVSSQGFAYSLSYEYKNDGSNVPTTTVVGAFVEDFEGKLKWTWEGNFDVVSGSAPNLYAAPWSIFTSAKETSFYITVPKSLSSTPVSATAALGGLYNYLGLLWGSIDTYNSIEFLNNGSVVASISGSNLPPANGNQFDASTNLYVNIFGLPDFNAFRMISTNYAFEADNIAVARVPEPTTMLLLGVGLLGLAGLSRRRFRN